MIPFPFPWRGQPARTAAPAEGPAAPATPTATPTPTPPARLDVKHGPRGDRIVFPPGHVPDPGRRLRERDVKGAPSAPAAGAARPPDPQAVRAFGQALEACWRLARLSRLQDVLAAALHAAVAAFQDRVGGDLDERVVAALMAWVRPRLGVEEGPSHPSPAPRLAGRDTMWVYENLSRAFAQALGGATMPAACRDAFLATAPAGVLRGWDTGACELLAGFVHVLCRYPSQLPDPAGGWPTEPPGLACLEALARGVATVPALAGVLAREPDCVHHASERLLERRLSEFAGVAPPAQLHGAAAEVSIVLGWFVSFGKCNWPDRMKPLLAGASGSCNPHALAAVLAGVFDAQRQAFSMVRAEGGVPLDRHAYRLYDWLLREAFAPVCRASPAAQVAAGAVVARGLAGARERLLGLAARHGGDVLAVRDQLREALASATGRARSLGDSAPQFRAGFAAFEAEEGSFSLARGLEAGGDPVGLVLAALTLEGIHGTVPAVQALAMAGLLDAAAPVVMPWLAEEMVAGDFTRIMRFLLQPPATSQPSAKAPRDGQAAVPGPVQEAVQEHPPGGPSTAVRGLDEDTPSRPRTAKRGSRPGTVRVRHPALQVWQRQAGVAVAVTALLDWIDAYGQALGLAPGQVEPPGPMEAASWQRHAAILDEAVAFWGAAARGSLPGAGSALEADRATAIARFASGSRPGDPAPGLVVHRLQALREALEARRPAGGPKAPPR